METIEYKDISRQDFYQIILRFLNEATECTRILSSDNKNGKPQNNIKEIAERYAKMKDELKKIYKYSQKKANQSDSADYNTFMGAIQDMHVHAIARKDTTDFQKLFDSISEIESYARYWIDELK